MANKMKVLTAGVKSSKKKKKSSNNTKQQQQQSHSTSLDTANTTNDDTANNNDIESAAVESTNTVDNRLNTPVNDNINGGHSSKFFIINVWLFCVLQNQPQCCIQ